MDGRPLVITDDTELLDEVRRIAAATGVELQHAPGLPSRSSWRDAAVVVIDLDQVPKAVAAGLPRREGVVALARHAPDDQLWNHCLRLGVVRTVRSRLSVDVTIAAGPGTHTDPADEAEEQLVELLAGAAGGQVTDGRAIAVMGACGGAGASVFAASIALAAHRHGRDVLLADCDRWGPGLDVVLGFEAEGGVRWSDVAAPAGRLDQQLLRQALPALAVSRGQVPVLGFDSSAGDDIPVSVMEVVVDSARRAGDIAVLDLPRAPTPAGDRAAELSDLTVLVVPANVRGCFAARRQLRHLAELDATAGLVVRGPSQGGLGADDIAEALGIEVLATMRPQAGLGRDLDRGRPPGSDPKSPLGRAARAVLQAADAVPV